MEERRDRGEMEERRDGGQRESGGEGSGEPEQEQRDEEEGGEREREGDDKQDPYTSPDHLTCGGKKAWRGYHIVARDMRVNSSTVKHTSVHQEGNGEKTNLCLLAPHVQVLALGFGEMVPCLLFGSSVEYRDNLLNCGRGRGEATASENRPDRKSVV